MEDRQKINEITLSKKGNAYLKLFTRYLKQHHCFGSFQKALFKQNGYNSNKRLKNYCEACNFRIIDYAFKWLSTAEGHDYWSRLNFSFQTLGVELKKLKRKERLFQEKSK